MGAMRRYILFGLTLCLGLFLWWTSTRPSIATQFFTVEMTPTQQVVGRVYVPQSSIADDTAPVPALLLCHGVNSSKDTLAPLYQFNVRLHRKELLE